MYTLLGGTEDQPWTMLCNKKIFLIYDMSHLAKSIRNNLLNGDFVFDKNKIVSLKILQLRMILIQKMLHVL